MACTKFVSAGAPPPILQLDFRGLILRERKGREGKGDWGEMKVRVGGLYFNGAGMGSGGKGEMREEKGVEGKERDKEGKGEGELSLSIKNLSGAPEHRPTRSVRHRAMDTCSRRPEATSL